MLGAAEGPIAMFRRSMSAWVGPVKFWKAGATDNVPVGIPVSRIARRSTRLGLPLLYEKSFGNAPSAGPAAEGGV